MKSKRTRRTKPTPEQLADEKDLLQFCHEAAVRLFQTFDREEAEAGLPDPYSPRKTRQRRIKSKPARHVGMKGAER